MATTAGGVFIPGNAALIKAGGRFASKNAKIAEDVATSGRRSASQSPGAGTTIGGKTLQELSDSGKRLDPTDKG